MNNNINYFIIYDDVYSDEFKEFINKEVSGMINFSVAAMSVSFDDEDYQIKEDIVSLSDNIFRTIYDVKKIVPAEEIEYENLIEMFGDEFEIEFE